ncbi:hypothetical protein BU16DRAFT_543467 [Lophium mytilinum]|uniref:RING-type domain-containing protein n=1 Tax=Lophium mytilinum TaxID=390894 RepID=A0A6A6QGW0_9PEZI|nr:hypothetical protein BU16DRAFT_543467 [Lophium mytilinum]
MAASTSTLNVVDDSTRPPAANIILRPSEALTGGVMKNLHVEGTCTYGNLVIHADGDAAQHGDLHILFPREAIVKRWYGEATVPRDVRTILPATRARERLQFPHGRNPYAGLRDFRLERVNDTDKRMVTKGPATTVFEFGEQSVRVRTNGVIALECLEPEDETELQDTSGQNEHARHRRFSNVWRRLRGGNHRAAQAATPDDSPSEEEIWEMPTGALEDVPLEFVGPRTNVDELAKPTDEKDLPECSICQDAQYGVGHRAVKLNACGHIFGEECLSVMFNHRFAASNTCPNCRVQLFKKKERQAVRG